MKTYRYSGHSRSDPATYRPAGELDIWKQRDPILVFAQRLAEEGAIASGGLEAMREQVRDAVELATAEALAAPEPATGELLRHVTA
jgi:pyruvate dehydrogenase E1 component alpha subunit